MDENVLQMNRVVTLEDKIAEIEADDFTRVTINSPFGFDAYAYFGCDKCGCLVVFPKIHRETCS